MVRPRSLFFGKDQGMAIFLAFLVLMTLVIPMFSLSRLERIALGVIFSVTLFSGAAATIQHRILVYLVVALTITTFAFTMLAEFSSLKYPEWETVLKLACLAVLVVMTIRQTFRPGAITVHRIMGGIAGYMLLGVFWAFAYQLVGQVVPDPIHFSSPVAGPSPRQPSHLLYFSFATLTTVGYGDTYPVHRVARSLAIAEALVGQLYLAILIATLVGMALQAQPGSSAEKEHG